MSGVDGQVEEVNWREVWWTKGEEDRPAVGGQNMKMRSIHTCIERRI
jgi:hypothetical protein